MVEVFIPLRTRSQPSGASANWILIAKKKREDRTLAWMCLRAGPKPPPLPVIVTLIRVAPRAIDPDNLPASGLKLVKDEVAIWLGLPTNIKGHAEDRDPRVHWKFKQGKRRPREYGVLVQVETTTQAVVDGMRHEEEWRGQGS